MIRNQLKRLNLVCRWSHCLLSDAVISITVVPREKKERGRLNFPMQEREHAALQDHAERSTWGTGRQDRGEASYTSGAVNAMQTQIISVLTCARPAVAHGVQFAFYQCMYTDRCPSRTSCFPHVPKHWLNLFLIAPHRSQLSSPAGLFGEWDVSNLTDKRRTSEVAGRALHVDARDTTSAWRPKGNPRSR